MGDKEKSYLSVQRAGGKRRALKAGGALPEISATMHLATWNPCILAIYASFVSGVAAASPSA